MCGSRPRRIHRACSRSRPRSIGADGRRNLRPAFRAERKAAGKMRSAHRAGALDSTARRCRHRKCRGARSRCAMYDGTRHRIRTRHPARAQALVGLRYCGLLRSKRPLFVPTWNHSDLGPASRAEPLARLNLVPALRAVHGHPPLHVAGWHHGRPFVSHRQPATQCYQILMRYFELTSVPTSDESSNA